MATEGEANIQVSTSEDLPPTPEQSPPPQPAAQSPAAQSPAGSPAVAEQQVVDENKERSSPNNVHKDSTPVPDDNGLPNDNCDNHISDSDAVQPPSADDNTDTAGNTDTTGGTETAGSDSNPLYFKENSTTPTSATKRKRKDTATESGTHRVTFTVTISKAIPTVDDEESAEGYDSKRRRRIVEAPRAQNYFHCEYSLLPDDEEIVKTDVVTFGVAAKIYTERQDPKVLKTWMNGDQTWVAWTHAHTVTISDELLTKLFTHKLQLRVWDTRDKLSTRARYDRPKAFKLPSTKPGEDVDGGGVKPLVLGQVASYESLQPKKSYIDRPLPSQTMLADQGDVTQDVVHPELPLPGNVSDHVAAYVKSSSSRVRSVRPQSPTPTTLVQVPNSQKHGENVKTYSRLGKLAGVSPPTEPQPNQSAASRSLHQSSKSKSELKPTTKPSRTSPRAASPGNKTAESHIVPQGDQVQAHSERKGSAGSQPRPAQDAQKPRRSKKQEAAAQARAEEIKKNGICSITIQMAKLFAGVETVTERLDKSVGGLEDMFISVALSGSLMSEQQHRKLNPLVVRVSAATDMPDTPLSFDELRLRCEPAYVRYKMFDIPEHTSVGREQDKNIYWNDIHVVLAGILDPPRLREFLHGPPIEIEVHDRDRIQEKQKLKPTLFGDDLEDEKISNVGTISSKRTVHNPFSSKDKRWDPYGVGKVDMSGLLLGQKVIHLKVPIHQCDTPDILGIRDNSHDGRLIGIAGAVDGPDSSPLAPGHYIQSGASLKVKVEVAYPIVTPEELAANSQLQPTSQCPFARIVYKFDYKNITFLTQLQSLVTDINAVALGLDEMPAHVVKAALSTYKLSLEQQTCSGLDIVTGFQVLDGNQHLFVLEGLLHGGVLRMWNTLKQSENSDVRVLYHSDMAFSERLYGLLDVDLCRIKLHQTLNNITSQPLLYVRDMVPKPCFKALTKLDELSRTTKLRAAVRNDLFPTADMVISMSKEFGIPMTAEDFEELVPRVEKAEPLDALNNDEQPHTSRVWTPIDNYNANYMEKVNDRSRSSTVNYLSDNKTMVREKSMLNTLERSKTMPLTIKMHTQPAYNYSTQSRNSTEQAKEALRNMLKQNPDERYTYCQEYHNSMTVVPVNVEALKKSEEKASKDAMKTANGFVYPGKKTMIESNAHPRKLHHARVEALEKPWEELSRLPRGVTVPRRCYTWNKRHHDLDTWTKPNPVFGQDEPITIHLAGEKLKQERLQAAAADTTTWRSKLVVDDPRGYFHRCATETELRDAGFKSSDQIARLQGLRKDPPVKYTLHKHGLALKEIPPLNVVSNPSVDTEKRMAGQNVSPAIKDEFDKKVKGFVPGLDNQASITVDTNQIPVQDYQHDTFIQEKGQDFNVYHKERSSLHKRHIQPMTEEEYRAHIFRMPSHYRTLPRYYTLPDVETFKRQTTKDTMDSGFMSLATSKENTQAYIETK